MNNYDMSSSGVNCSLTVQYDTSGSQWRFDDWLQGADGVPVERVDLGGRDNYLYLIGDSSAPYYKKSQLNKLKKSELWQLICNYELDWDVYDNFLKSHLVRDLMGISIKRHYEYLASQYSWGSIQDHIEHDYFISHGYSQGDSVLIVKIDGLTDGYKKYIDNIFWDCPIYISIIVNGEEYREYELLDDDYDYDADQLKQAIEKLDIPQQAKVWLIDHVPAQPEYN